MTTARPPPSGPPPPARVARLRRRLLAWFDAGRREFPWRFPQHGADPYRVWLSEVMLQQTRTESVLPYYRRFVERWPTLEALAAARDADVLAAWSGLGYYARCRNLLAAAREALAGHGGLPASLEALRELPGFGPYTAGAVASIAFAVPAPAVDGNAARVLARLFGVEGEAGPARNRRLEQLAWALVSRKRPGDLNQSLMELGATVCRPRAPRCPVCPVAASCAARRSGRLDAIPARSRRAPREALTLAFARVERSGSVLLERRPDRGLFGGLWALPGVEVADGDDPRRALRRELRRRLGAAPRVGEEIAAVERVLTHRDLVLRVYRCGLARDPCKGGSEGLAWARPEDLGGLGMATAMRRALEASDGTGLGSAKAVRRASGASRTGGRKALTSRGPFV